MSIENIEHKCDGTRCRGNADTCHCENCFNGIVEEVENKARKEGYDDGFSAGKQSIEK